MQIFQNMPFVSVVVVFVILALFAAAVALLFTVCAIYRREAKLATVGDTHQSHLLHDVLQDYSVAYKTFGEQTNTPAIVTCAINDHMSFPLFAERFLNNAVSLFVTLGLFGTFLGLSMSVSSLTELLGSSTGEWQNALNNVGEGLMSALSGMGVAFYTSLVGVACSILLTILRAIFSPDTIRANLENEMELWLDHRVAPRLTTEHTTDDSELIRRMTVGLNSAAATMDKALTNSTQTMRQAMDGFSGTVEAFNQGVHDFSEFDYNLRGTVERMDVAVRELATAIRRVSRGPERGDKA